MTKRILCILLLLVVTLCAQSSASILSKLVIPNATQPVSKCDVSRTDPVNGDTGSITFPLDGQYSSLLQCQWVIESNIAGTSGINLVFSMLDVEDSLTCRYDYLDVVTPDGKTVLKRYCGTKYQFSEFFPYSSVILRFVSDIGDEGRGFKLSFTFLKALPANWNGTGAVPTTPSVKDLCLVQHNRSSNGGSFLYPISGTYPNNANCQWNIQSSTLPQHTRIIFEMIDIETSSGCTRDALKVLTSDGIGMPPFCGRAKFPLPIIYPSNSLSLRFISDSLNTGRGFRLTYAPSPFTKGQCISAYESLEDGGAIEYPVPGMHNRYNNSISCIWTVQSPVPGMHIDVYILSMNIETCNDVACDCDALTISDGITGTPLQRRCGISGRNAIVESFATSSIRFEFTSDDSVNKNGFALYYMYRDPKSLMNPVNTTTPSCGVSRSMTRPGVRIVGGDLAPPGSWPWMAFFQIGTSSYCGGSLIDKYWVITAAHCAKIIADNSELIVRIGANDLSSRQPNEQWIRPQKITVHESYQDRSGRNDIALIKLAEPAFATPICLPAQNESLPLIGTQLMAAGWGEDYNETNDETSGLRQVTLSLLDSKICTKMYQGYYNLGMICAGDLRGGKDSCQGDSGGPLIQRLSTGENRYKLVGLTSSGAEECALPNAPGIYTKVSNYVDWITRKMAQS